MTDLFVPPSTPPAALEPIISADSDSDIADLDPPDSEGVLPAETTVVTEPVGLYELASVTAGDAVEGATSLSLEASVLPVASTIATVDTVFFYSRLAGRPVLYQINLAEGSLTTANSSTDLFSTALDGLFTAAPGGLGGPGTASPEPPSRVFTLVEGTSGNNFLIGTAADNALFGFDGDDLILTSRGDNLAFGGAGNDTLVGGAGENGLFGGNGDDAIEGGAGDDLLVGGAGNDILYGGGGANTLVGSAGADVFRLNSPGAYDPLVGGSTGADTILDFNAAEGDLLDFSMIATQPLFDGSNLLPFLSFVQVGADTHVQVATPLGQTSTEAILIGVDADSITPASLTFTPPSGVPLLK
ncbi:MAG: type I secretion C-terminal target domain-containing protein [Nodosilinea sp.]